MLKRDELQLLENLPTPKNKYTRLQEKTRSGQLILYFRQQRVLYTALLRCLRSFADDSIFPWTCAHLFQRRFGDGKRAGLYPPVEPCHIK